MVARRSAVPGILKLIAAAPSYGRFDVARCAESIALALATNGDHDGARAVREAANPPGKPIVVGQARGAVPVEWYDPADLSADLVLDAATGSALSRLADELTAAPSFIAAGIDAPTRALFCGPSGTGKTLAVRWLGGRLGISVAVVRLDRVIDSHYGETAKNMAKAFEAAASCPSILFVDEIDGICSRRGAQMDVAESGRVTSSLLQQLDMAPPEQIVIAASNFREHIDAALLRRLSTEVTFGMPDAAAREAMVQRWWTKTHYSADAIAEAVRVTDGMSGAVARTVAMGAARRAILSRESIQPSHVVAARTGEA